MTADKSLLCIFQFIREHIECNRAALLEYESTYIKRTVSVVPVASEVAEVVA